MVAIGGQHLGVERALEVGFAALGLCYETACVSELVRIDRLQQYVLQGIALVQSDYNYVESTSYFLSFPYCLIVL